MTEPINIDSKRKTIELWAGFECTVNRIQDRWMDQLELSGHADRDTDLDLLSEIGAKAVRYPVLWERLAPNGLDEIDWSWTDRRLNRLRDLGIRPIVGLVHHGSGPAGTDLLDPTFPEKLAQFARKVAERYPWIDAYTPVNEPLTTARFSCLYGFWYPHRHSANDFLSALLNQVRAVNLAMREVRAVNPHAQLVQTEDLGKSHSTRHLSYQADFENERRWLSLDILCGKFTPSSAIWSWVTERGIAKEQLEWFIENPCPPDILGFNYYLSSERFIDERTSLYPDLPVGGNGKDQYIDIEAARILPEGILGAGTLLREAWDRFGLPLALTELHNGCTREEQARWFVEQWDRVSSLLYEGIDVRAVTAWSLLGSFNWNTLVIRDGAYEPGVYDVRAPRPWPTFMVSVLKQLSRNEKPRHPVFNEHGWWWREDRFRPNPAPYAIRGRTTAKPIISRPILITGATGSLGQAFGKICSDRGLSHHLVTRSEMDIADSQSVTRTIERWNPWAIINAAGYVKVDDAEAETELCFRENTMGPAILATHCRTWSLPLVTFSSDLVFDGSKRTPYLESDAVHPINTYGRSKIEAEKAVLSLLPSALVVRTSAFFGPWDNYNFVTRALRALASGQSFSATDSHVVSPTYMPDLVNMSLDLMLDGAHGIWHLANRGALSWAQLALKVARMAKIPTGRFYGFKNHDWTFAAPRPEYAVLGSERHAFMPSLEDALERYLRHRQLQPGFSVPATPEMPDQRAA